MAGAGRGREKVGVDFCYDVAFYCVVVATELGFAQWLRKADLTALDAATGMLKAALNADEQYKRFSQHPHEDDLGFLYGVIAANEQVSTNQGAALAETNLCFFAAQQIDRSTCGSGTAAWRALAHAKATLPPEKASTYHSLISNSHGGQESFVARAVGQPFPNPNIIAGGDVVRVQVEGQAFHTDCATFVVEPEDGISAAGFTLKRATIAGQGWDIPC